MKNEKNYGNVLSQKMIKLKKYEKLPLSKSNDITERMQSKYSEKKWTSNLDEMVIKKEVTFHGGRESSQKIDFLNM